MQISSLRQFIGQFANTFREWHYLIAGFALGVLVGIEYALRRFQ